MNPTPQLEQCLSRAVEMEASDLHLQSGYPPVIRQHGRLMELSEEITTDTELQQWLGSICSEAQFDHFRRDRNLDLALQLTIGGELRRFRCNFFFSDSDVGACFRVIPASIPSFGWSGFPRDVAQHVASFRNGLVLFTGVTGAGKTTSLAMVIDLLNQQGGSRIITVEEPVEYLFPKRSGSLVSQREVGVDVTSFADGLKYGLRQDPDVILIGEIRDLETAQMALSAAETGHLVFSTLHTRDAKGALTRFIDLFPQAGHDNVRTQLAMSLRAIISQHLVPAIDPTEKRQLALEIMYNNSRIAAAIRQNKLTTIDNAILTSRADGMIPLDESIRRLMAEGRIDRETAGRFVSEPSMLG